MVAYSSQHFLIPNSFLFFSILRRIELQYNRVLVDLITELVSLSLYIRINSMAEMTLKGRRQSTVRDSGRVFVLRTSLFITYVAYDRQYRGRGLKKRRRKKS